MFKKFSKWHQEQLFWYMEKLNLGVYEVAWISWIKGFLMGVLLLLLSGCGSYQLSTYQPVKTEVVYLDEIKKDSVNLFTSLEFNTITLDFRPLRPRFYWGHNYGYWGYRPLWMDFDFYYGFGNYYSYHYPYYSYYYRPWNVWDWYMRPWRPYNNWYQGPFNNPSYNVVYNASRRGSLTLNNRNISNRIIVNRIENVNNRPVNNNAINNLINNYKPNNNNNIYKPNSNSNNIRIKPNNNYRPSNNNYKPSNNNYKPSNNYSRPSNNYSKPSYSPSPSYNNSSRPSNNSSRGGNSRGIN